MRPTPYPFVLLLLGGCLDSMNTDDPTSDELRRRRATATADMATAPVADLARNGDMAQSIPSSGGSWFVRPGGSGAKNGGDWSNAWDIGAIGWSSVHPGDTIWLAGGTYTSGLSFGKSGGGGNPITVRRVLSTDQAPSSAAGWTSSFDALVVLPGVNFNGGANYTTLDGRSEYGIKVTFGNGGRGITIASGGTTSTDVTIQYVEVAGPGLTTVESDAIFGTSWNGSSNVPITGTRISHCYIHDSDTLIMRANWHDSIVEYTKLYNAKLNFGISNPPHPDVVYSYPCYNSIFRYNVIDNNDAEGVFYSYGLSDGEYWYGNTFRNMNGYAFEVRDTSDIGGMSYGAFYLYNNVFFNCGYGPVLMAGPISSASRGYDNIFEKTNNPPAWGAASGDYNYFVTGTSTDGGAHSLSGASPFVSGSTGNFHLVAGSGAINRGLALQRDGFVDKDPDGNLRAADGNWDIGAYELLP